MKNYKIDILENEFWYGGAVKDGVQMPFGKDSEYSADFTSDNKYNQVSTAFLSTAGRYFFSDRMKIAVKNGAINVEYENEIVTGSNGNTLKSAYAAVCRRIFHFNGKPFEKDLFTKPQFSTWMALGVKQDQSAVLAFADDILRSGFDCSVLIIDDSWSRYYGEFEFDKGRFPSPEEMIRALHNKGMKVMLWECPFISPDSSVFRELRERDCLVKNADGSVAIREWWNGYSAILDMSNPAAEKFLADKNAALTAMGVDGFKLDAGDIEYYKDDDITFGGVTATEQCKLWSLFAERYDYNELRASYNTGGRRLFQRQCDKWHSWTENGITEIIPNMIAQALAGYSVSAPDMVGGGSVGKDKDFDEELFVRYAEIAAFMPIMQFSMLPQKRLSEKNFETVKKYAKLHGELGEYIYAAVCEFQSGGNPVITPLEYAFPHQGYEEIKNAFMLGEGYLVFAVTKKGVDKISVKLPRGCDWEYYDGTVFKGGTYAELSVPLEAIAYFHKIG